MRRARLEEIQRAKPGVRPLTILVRALAKFWRIRLLTELDFAGRDRCGSLAGGVHSSIIHGKHSIAGRTTCITSHSLGLYAL